MPAANIEESLSCTAFGEAIRILLDEEKRSADEVLEALVFHTATFGVGMKASRGASYKETKLQLMLMLGGEILEAITADQEIADAG
jgi:hypothetical protein